jgi:hypothetical protein
VAPRATPAARTRGVSAKRHEVLRGVILFQQMLAAIGNRIRLRRLAGALVAAWFLVHVALYVARIYDADAYVVRNMCHVIKHLWAWQAGSFFALLLIMAIRRPAIAGGVMCIHLIAFTAVLLAFARDAALVAKLVVLLLWAGCAAWGMRQALSRAVGLRYASWGVAAAAAYAALIPLCFLLGFLHLLRPSIVAALAIATALPGAVAGMRRLTVFPRELLRRFCQFDVFELCWLEVIWLVLAIALVGASVPEFMSDGVRGHLPYIHQVVRDHGISHQYACWYWLQPMAAQTCCAAFAAVGSDAAAKWFSWLALVALVLLVVDEVHRRSGSRDWGMFAGAAVLGCPILIEVATTLYVDHVATLLCTAGFVVLFRALRPPCLRGILLSAAIMASMVQVKYPGLVFSVVWGLILCGSLFRQCSWRVAARWSMAGGAMLVAAALPWYTYVYAGTGNPFFPYLHSWFPSPYWSDKIAIQKVYEGFFKLPPGLAGALSFPWTATYQTERFYEGYDGFLGFWVLALAPCWFFARSRQGGPRWWDMALAGVAAIAGVVSYTPYVRYWMPAYPLLVVACVVAAGSMAWPWKLEKPWVRVILGTGLGIVLLVPLPFICRQCPWDEYTKRISYEGHLAMRFPGYQAVQQINRVLGPDDGVICTGFQGVHLVAGRSYEFAFWWSDVHRVHDVPSFDEFCRRNRIRYWVVDHTRMMLWGFDSGGPIGSHYWTDARTVAAHGAVVVYDVASPRGENGPAVAQRLWPPVLEKTNKPWAASDSPTGWIQLVGNAVESPMRDSLVVTPDKQIGHSLPPQSEGRMCRVLLNVCSKEFTYPVLEVLWYGADGAVIERVKGEGYGKSDYKVCVYSQVPPGAKAGWVHLGAWKGPPVQLKQGAVEYWSLAAPASIARRSGRRDSL